MFIVLDSQFLPALELQKITSLIPTKTGKEDFIQNLENILPVFTIVST